MVLSPFKKILHRHGIITLWKRCIIIIQCIWKEEMLWKWECDMYTRKRKSCWSQKQQLNKLYLWMPWEFSEAKEPFVTAFKWFLSFLELHNTFLPPLSQYMFIPPRAGSRDIYDAWYLWNSLRAAMHGMIQGLCGSRNPDKLHFFGRNWQDFFVFNPVHDIGLGLGEIVNRV